MKQSWTRLAQYASKRMSQNMRDSAFGYLFLKHHKNAEEIIVNKDGEPLAAIYITPIGSHQEMAKKVFAIIRSRMECGEL